MTRRYISIYRRASEHEVAPGNRGLKRARASENLPQRDSKRNKAKPAKAKTAKEKPIRPEPSTTKPGRAKSTTQQPIRLNAAPTLRLQVFTFGTGSSGELGLGQFTHRTYCPTLNEALNPDSAGVVSIAAGGMHAAAITHDNKILTWGVNDEFALGRNTTFEMKTVDAEDSDSDDEDPELNPLEATPTPIPAHDFPAGTQFAQITAGDSATFALTEDGLVYGWGTFRDSNGKLSFSVDQKGELITVQKVPLLIPGLKNIVQICAGCNFVLALDSDGKVFSWGNNEQYQLGHRQLTRHRPPPLMPKLVALPKGISSISTGAYHAFAIDKSGSVWAWGSNNFGQTGIREGAGEDSSFVFPPKKAESLESIKLIQGGKHHSIAVTKDGKCLTWGKVDDGRTGINVKDIPLDDPSILVEYGRPRVLLTPTALPVSNCSFAAAGDDHGLAVTNGATYSWGLNNSGQCGLGPKNSKRDPEDQILTATAIGDAIAGRNICWAGAGGQYSILACVS